MNFGEENENSFIFILRKLKFSIFPSAVSMMKTHERVFVDFWLPRSDDDLCLCSKSPYFSKNCLALHADLISYILNHWSDCLHVRPIHFFLLLSSLSSPRTGFSVRRFDCLSYKQKSAKIKEGERSFVLSSRFFYYWFKNSPRFDRQHSNTESRAQKITHSEPSE